MKTREQYLDAYFKRRNEYKQKNETWRFSLTKEEFLSGLERIEKWSETSRLSNYLNEYAIQRGEEAQVSVLLMGSITREEFIEQCRQLREEAKNYCDK
jgi:hypothetical protein